MTDIVVVGGGVVGTTLAYHLRDAEADVTLLERESLGAGSTGDSLSVFGRWLNVEGEYRDICDRSWELYEPLLEEGVLNFHRGGYLAVADSEAYLTELEGMVDDYAAAGLDPRVLAPAETAAFGLDPEGVGAGALYLDQGRFTHDPGPRIVHHFADEAARAGVEIRERTRVTDVDIESGAVTGVETSSGTLPADLVVNAAGPWAPKLNDMVGVDLPLKHTHAPIVEYDTSTEFGPDKPLSLLAFEEGLYFIGGFPRKAWAGDSPGEIGAGEFEDWDRVDADVEFGSSVGNRFRAAVADRIESTLPPLADATSVDEWKCLRTVTPDHYPLVGETDVEGFHVAVGMSGQGITIAPAVTELLAAYIETGDRPAGIEPLWSRRFD